MTLKATFTAAINQNSASATRSNRLQKKVAATYAPVFCLSLPHVNWVYYESRGCWRGRHSSYYTFYRTKDEDGHDCLLPKYTRLLFSKPDKIAARFYLSRADLLYMAWAGTFGGLISSNECIRLTKPCCLKFCPLPPSYTRSCFPLQIKSFPEPQLVNNCSYCHLK